MSSEAEERQMSDILASIEKEKLENIRLEFLDTNAVSRSRTVPARHLEETCRSGTRFPLCLFVLDPTGHHPEESGLTRRFLYSDMTCFPDLSTYKVLPWVKNTCGIFVSRSTEEEGDDPKFLIDPRNIAKAQLKALNDMGLSIFSSFEHETWLVDKKSKEPITVRTNAFATTILSEYQEFVDGIARNFTLAGIDVEGSHFEMYPGVLEMTMKPSFGMRAADNAATFRTGMKEMALQNGFMASFMTMPFDDEHVANTHFNHSLWSLDGTGPIMYNSSHPRSLSEIGEYWLAGILEHAPALTALQAPTINCREMFKSQHKLAPSYATWGFDNRTCALRVKRSGPSGLYLENRLGSGAGNPYIVMASTIAAGLDGIKRKLPLQPPMPTNVNEEQSTCGADAVPLPVDIECALDALKRDTVIAEAIGRDFIDALQSIRRFEMKGMVGDRFAWSRDVYFEFI